MVVWPAVKIATTVAAEFMVSVKVVGVVAPVWPGREVEERFMVVVLLAAMVRCAVDGWCSVQLSRRCCNVSVHGVFERMGGERCCLTPTKLLAILSAIHIRIAIRGTRNLTRVKGTTCHEQASRNKN